MSWKNEKELSEKTAVSLFCLTLLFPALCGTVRAGASTDPQPTRRKTAGRVRSGMAYVPGGTFMMGTETEAIPRLLQLFGVRRAELFESESLRHPVTLSPFYIDRYEVTNARFKRFLGFRCAASAPAGRRR
ncbi:MAG TPA: SUMF1/EgtB/PvdO family nonheme iron enzyme [Pyrinomonadaceae bacterium]|nr:SUMF1/EgtB/PvdO family nonheme iron enzyme [Pyrinomonadaceae bacterium]